MFSCFDQEDRKIINMEYTNVEYCDMLIYGECGQNANLAAHVYAERFPNRAAPYPNVFSRLIHRVRETGSVIVNIKEIGRVINNEENEEAVLACIEEDSTRSIRDISRNIGVSKSIVQRILRSNKIYAYHYTKVQNLWPQDYARRLNFCTWIIEQEQAEPGFVHKILFTDESLFTREGICNIHNYHIWSDENPHSIITKNYQQRFGINLWAGIFNNKIIGPFELPARTNSQIYGNFLRNEVPVLLEDIPLQQRINMIFQHDVHHHIMGETCDKI